MKARQRLECAHQSLVLLIILIVISCGRRDKGDHHKTEQTIGHREQTTKNNFQIPKDNKITSDKTATRNANFSEMGAVKLRNFIEETAAKEKRTANEVVGNLLSETHDTRDCQRLLLSLISAYPECDFWTDVVTSMQTSDARRLVISWIRQIPDEQHLAQVEKIYEFIDPGNDRNILVGAIVKYKIEHGVLDNAIPVITKLEYPEEKIIALEEMAKSVSYMRYNDINSVSPEVWGWMLATAGELGKETRSRIEWLAKPRRSITREELNRAINKSGKKSD